MSDTANSILSVGEVLDDKWVILELIGRGGMGEVYRAHQLHLKRDVAIKVISREWLKFLGGDEEEIESTAARFRREVEAMAQVRHPNVLQIFDYGSTSLRRKETDVPVEYLAIEYVPGATVRATMSEEGFYPDDERMKTWLTDYFLPVLDGVQAIHALGIVHRDLKPENVLLDGATPKISDFGLARSCRLQPVTREIDIRGTPPYMAPEQFFEFGRVDQRADIYSLGKILYEAVCGKMPPDKIPFRGVCLTNPETPLYQNLDRTIRNATAEDPKDRIPSVQAFFPPPGNPGTKSQTSVAGVLCCRRFRLAACCAYCSRCGALPQRNSDPYHAVGIVLHCFASRSGRQQGDRHCTGEREKSWKAFDAHG